MWSSPLGLLPAANVVVVAIDDDGIYCAKRTRQEEDSEWIECTIHGDPVWGARPNMPMIREPLWWQHLPGTGRKSKRKKT